MTTGPGPEAFLREHAAGIARAAGRLAGRIRRTPLLDTDLGPVKPECLQVTGSFKPRGALNSVLAAVEADGRPAGLVTASSGNHGQALAWAARALGLPVTVVMAADSNPAKVAAVRALGAEVVSAGVTMANREAVLASVSAATGYLPVHPFDDWEVIHGQATAAREILEDRPAVDCIVVPVGGGGLISGTALAAKAADRSIRVVGVEPEQADDAARSFRTGTHVRRPAGPTVADGARAASIGVRPYEVICERRLVDGIVTVGEPALAAATAETWARTRLLVEPTGALPVAARMAGLVPDGPGTVLLLSGGNVDPAVVSRSSR